MAAEARSDGPCCLLSAVAHRCDKRLRSAVVVHAPDHEDIRALLGRLHTAWTARDVTLVGRTTDGAARSPVPLAEVLGGVPHQRWVVHLVAEVVHAVRGAVASARQRLAAKPPTWPQGRPRTQAATAAARKNKRLEQTRGDVYPSRPLVVPHPRSQSARQRWWRIPRGLPRVRTLRESLAQVYVLGDRRCRPQAALHNLDKLRRRLLRFTQVGETLKKRFAPPVEKACTFRDDTLPPSTSHAVERGTRRSRTRQKQVYRVRTQAQISARLALDMW